MKSLRSRWGPALATLISASVLVLCSVWILSPAHAFERPFTPGTPKGFTEVGMTGTYFYHVANFPALCGQYTVYHNDVIVLFDSQKAGGLEIGGFGDGHVVAEHQFQTPGIYPMHAEVEGVCRDNNTSDWGSRQEVNGTILVFQAPIAVKSLTCAPGSIMVGQQSVCTLTLMQKAPVGGTQVRLMCPNIAHLSVPLTTIVPANLPSKTFRVKGIGQGSCDVYATSGVPSNVVSAKVTVN